jgi:hypothetical protein
MRNAVCVIHHINDPKFAEAAAWRLLQLIRGDGDAG